MVAEMEKQDMKFPKYHKVYATNFKFVSKFFFNFEKMSESKYTQKNLQEMILKHKEYSDLNNYKKNHCSHKMLELLFNINKALLLSFRVIIIIIIIITVTVFIIHFC